MTWRTCVRRRFEVKGGNGATHEGGSLSFPVCVTCKWMCWNALRSRPSGEDAALPGTLALRNSARDHLWCGALTRGGDGLSCEVGHVFCGKYFLIHPQPIPESKMLMVLLLIYCRTISTKPNLTLKEVAQPRLRSPSIPRLFYPQLPATSTPLKTCLPQTHTHVSLWFTARWNNPGCVFHEFQPSCFLRLI